MTTPAVVENKLHYRMLDLSYEKGCRIKAHQVETAQASEYGPYSVFTFLGDFPRIILDNNTIGSVAHKDEDG